MTLRPSWHAAAVPIMLVLVVFALSAVAAAQVTKTDYERAQGLRETYQAATVDVPDGATWVGKTNRFYYRKTVSDGHAFVLVDAATLDKRPAFDHTALAAAMSKIAGEPVPATKLPFNTFRFTDDEKAVEFNVGGARWRCPLSDYACTREEPPPPGEIRRGTAGQVRAPDASAPGKPKPSPDGAWEALVVNYNIAIRKVGNAKTTQLSTDGSEGQYYDPASIVWSPDSKKLAAYRVRPGYRRLVHYVDSSPRDQVQPKHWALQYAKPGDVLDVEQPVLFHVDPAAQLVVAPDLFPNPFDMSDLVWRKDSRAITFEYNQRGHQVYRVIEVDAATGKARAIVSEEPKTFFYYNAATGTRQGGKRFRRDLADGSELIWMSERDGWNHLYLYDGTTGTVKNQITRGEWVVRGVERVDEERRQIWFSAGGMDAGKDPYFAHYYRINFDGSGLTKLTTVDADHEVRLSQDLQYYVDTYSRVDLPTVSELHRASDGSLVATIERGDITALKKAGWAPPEVFTAKGRDGRTDIWGIIYRPRPFDPSKKYAVIENIYAGPHGSHVPKNFSPYSSMQAQADLGFVVVQIDGMGTSNRSKAFQDRAWQNLKDAGFPDRILWHRAVAARYPWYDIARVGIYGGSAGGQNAMGALLFHPDFYKVAVAYAGCHDNRMDKIWWNEQWMGWPIGPQYAESSNVDNAWRLQGHLLLVVGELDTNVDPASTYQVVSALLRANKQFDLLVIPGAEHNAGRGGEFGPYGERKQFDFFLRHLLRQEPPDWNRGTPSTPTGG